MLMMDGSWKKRCSDQSLFMYENDAPPQALQEHLHGEVRNYQMAQSIDASATRRLD